MFVHWLHFCGVSFCGSRERVFMFDYDTEEKEHQNTRQSDLYSGATPPRTVPNQPPYIISYIILVNKIHGKMYKIMIINKLRKYKK
jgi:hypothetical protein